MLRQLASPRQKAGPLGPAFSIFDSLRILKLPNQSMRTI
jgi:hypothetical protein